MMRTIALLATLTMAGFLESCAHRPSAHANPGLRLEKIRLSSNGRGFTTATGRPFVPCGVTYYRPGTGWAPQVWKQFDPDATRRDFNRLKSMGMNCVRVFISYGSFYKAPGVLDPEGLKKFDEFLALAEETGLYVHPTGPDHWEGSPNWSPVLVEDDQTLRALEAFWKLFASRYRGRNVIFAYDLKNEPEVGWKNETLQAKWPAWLRSRYPDELSAAKAWNLTNKLSFQTPPLPGDSSVLKNPLLLDYQQFREDLADEWTRKQAAAIKAADPTALVTVGLIQWSVPALLPAGPRHYSAFNPRRQAAFLDFLEIHFYPLENGLLQYRDAQELNANLAYLESVVREVASAGRPVVLAEFGWYGGGQPTFNRNLRPATEAQHAEYCRRVLEVSEGFVVGWLNWGFYDHPGANDCSELTGLLTIGGHAKEWGNSFERWAFEHAGKTVPVHKLGTRPDMDWPACVTSRQAEDEFRRFYLQSFGGDYK